MRLALYNSTPRGQTPNLVALQDEMFASLPTALVCPLKAGMTLTALRTEVVWKGETLVACTELARPIRRTALRLIGRLDEQTSKRVMDTFLQLLAR